jgi:hypothetical protein
VRVTAALETWCNPARLRLDAFAHHRSETNQSVVWHDVPNICVWPRQSLLAEEVLRVGGRAARLHDRRRDLSIRAALLAQPPNPRITCELWVNGPTID